MSIERAAAFAAYIAGRYPTFPKNQPASPALSRKQTDWRLPSVVDVELAKMGQLIPPPTLEEFWETIPMRYWELPDLPPEGVSIVAHDYSGPRPYVQDEAGRRWLLDGSGDVA